jgi:hypothetical protein
MSVQPVTLILSLVTCYKCHIPFGLPEDFETRARRTHETFYCPNGHGQAWTGTSDLEQARQRARSLETRLTHVKDQLEATERSLIGHKAAKTRLKNRIAAGVCPCCNRQFQNLHRHMTGQHPDFGSTP